MRAVNDLHCSLYLCDARTCPWRHMCHDDREASTLCWPLLRVVYPTPHLLQCDTFWSPRDLCFSTASRAGLLSRLGEIEFPIGPIRAHGGKAVLSTSQHWRGFHDHGRVMRKGRDFVLSSSNVNIANACLIFDLTNAVRYLIPVHHMPEPGFRLEVSPATGYLPSPPVRFAPYFPGEPAGSGFPLSFNTTPCKIMSNKKESKRFRTSVMS